MEVVWLDPGKSLLRDKPFLARHRRWWARYLRMAASPAMAQNVIRMNMRLDIRAALSGVDVSTLILHRTDDSWIDVGHARYMAEHIPDATYVELPGADHRPWLGDVDAIADEIEVFLTGRKSRPRRRTLARTSRSGPPARADSGRTRRAGSPPTVSRAERPWRACPPRGSPVLSSGCRPARSPGRSVPPRRDTA